MLSDFQSANGWPEKHNPTLLSRSWDSLPDQGFHIFFDDSLSRNACLAGCGFFVSDNADKFYFGATRSFPGIEELILVKLLALRKALLHSHQLWIQPIFIIGDA